MPCPTAPADECWDVGVSWAYSGPPVDGFHIWTQPLVPEFGFVSCDTTTAPVLLKSVSPAQRIWHDVQPSGQLRACILVSAYNAVGESPKILSPMPGY